MTVVIFGAFLIAAVGYALGRITIKGVSLGTAGVFLMALLFGYLFTLPGLAELPILEISLLKARRRRTSSIIR